MIKKDRSAMRGRIKQRIRKKVLGTEQRPRLTVYRSLHHVYAQIVDDIHGKTLVASSSHSKELRDRAKSMKKKEVSKLVGMDVAKRALEKKIQTVVFDRNGYRYHGNVKALADGAREAGLKF
jgi:large subunit ribosomal protein L18